MNKFGQIVAAAVVGVATASLVALLRQKQRSARKQDVEDIQRWEEEGGQVLARRRGGSPPPTDPV
jgi:hypothetical protein